jgi:hypothetical protein
MFNGCHAVKALDRQPTVAVNSNDRSSIGKHDDFPILIDNNMRICVPVAVVAFDGVLHFDLPLFQSLFPWNNYILSYDYINVNTEN